jgi:hypothetical protein
MSSAKMAGDAKALKNRMKAKINQRVFMVITPFNGSE